MRLMFQVLNNGGLMAILYLFASLLWMLKDPSDRTRPVLVLALTANLFYGFALSKFMSGMDSLLPWKFDHYLYNLDAALGIPAASVARVLGTGVQGTIFDLVYQAMIPVMILFYVALPRNLSGPLLIAYAAELIAGPCCYAFLPAAGPAYAFGSSWLRTPPVDIGLVQVERDAERVSIVTLRDSRPRCHVCLWEILALVGLSGVCRDRGGDPGNR